MPLLNSPTIYGIPISLCSASKPKPQGLSYGSLRIDKGKNLKFAINASAGESGSALEFNVPFPSDYSVLLRQAKEAVELALKDNKQLMEIEFPTAGLESVPGDGEGGIEMTGSMQLIREFCDLAISPEKARQTRIFFPEANEVTFARNSVFEGSSLKLDYLTKPSFFQDFGFVSKVKMADRVKPEDDLFLVAYPYFNVNEMLVVEELYKEAVVNTSRKMIIFNGELDRIRSGCILSSLYIYSMILLLFYGFYLYYPPFFYPKLGALSQTFLPKMESVYYIHNFKGRNGGVLFRCYPGPWRVLRRVRNKYVCLHQQAKMPSLKEVALEILPSA
ncbi:hypothetical protein ACJIZ3_001835 [Penstemon smallii]|uniref:DUF1995 domain-containing protein n=1 Tax=Penstemon smallii TaxID=265156 RepID=A0ABD3U7X4_9LAMI